MHIPTDINGSKPKMLGASSRSSISPGSAAVNRPSRVAFPTAPSSPARVRAVRPGAGGTCARPPIKRSALLHSLAATCALAVGGAGHLAAQTAYTRPVGYVTLTALAGKANLLGLTLHRPTAYAGLAETISGTTLTEIESNFDPGLGSGAYLLELDGGISDGKVVPITGTTSQTLTLAEFLPSQSNINFRVLPMKSLCSETGGEGLINPIEVLGTADFNPDHADLILIPDGSGGFKKYFVSTHLDPAHPENFNTWVDADTGQARQDPLLYYPRAFFFLRRGSTDFSLIVSGEIKLENTRLSVAETFNYCSMVYPVGMTLEESSLAASLQPGTATTADIVMLQDEITGEFRRYFVSDGSPPLTSGWRRADPPPGGENTDESAAPMSSGFVIHRRAAQLYEALMTPPDFYQDLE